MNFGKNCSLYVSMQVKGTFQLTEHQCNCIMHSDMKFKKNAILGSLHVFDSTFLEMFSNSVSPKDLAE